MEFIIVISNHFDVCKVGVLFPESRGRCTSGKELAEENESTPLSSASLVLFSSLTRIQKALIFIITHGKHYH